MDKLHEFVEENLRKGVSPVDMKSHLMANGWKESDVNDALDSATGKKAKKRIVYAFVGVIIVAILALILISMTKISPIPPIIPSGNNSANLKPTDTVDDCVNKEYSIEKDACYKVFLAKGFDCETLEDNIEFTYCTRAYEETMLEGLEEPSESST